MTNWWFWFIYTFTLSCQEVFGLSSKYILYSLESGLLLKSNQLKELGKQLKNARYAANYHKRQSRKLSNTASALQNEQKNSKRREKTAQASPKVLDITNFFQWIFRWSRQKFFKRSGEGSQKFWKSLNFFSFLFY